MVITLTEQQKLAQKDQQEKIAELFNAYKNGVKQLGLFGKAGVGKTKSMIRLVNLIRQWDNSIKTIKAAANTHRAKDVLKENLDDDTIDCYTIASLLNYKRIISKDGKEEYKPSTITKYSKELRAQVSIPPPVSVADLIIIDECSQVNKETYDNIVNYATNAKVIIFMGDWHQTPPVEKDANKQDIDSPTFQLRYELLNIPFRYEGDLQRLADAVALEIDKVNANPKMTPSWKFLDPFIKDRGKDYMFYSGASEKQMSAFHNRVIESSKINVLKHSTLVCYRNDVVNRHSTNIRQYIVNSSDRFAVGDKLVAKENWGGCLTNGQTYVVTDISTEKYYLHNDFWLNPKTKKSYVHDGIKMPPVDIFRMSLLDDKGKVYNNVIIPVDENNRFLTACEITLKNLCSSGKFEPTYSWESYYNLKELFASLQYAYAVNTHVVQGDTYDTIFVDLSDIIDIKPITFKQKLQSFYTSVTRAKKKAYILY